MRKILFLTCTLSILAVSVFTSCVSQKKVLYLQNEQMLNDSVFMSIEYPNERTFEYKVQPGDNLYIRMASLDEKFAAYFNSMNQGSFSTSTGSNTSGNAGIYLNGYTVGSDGNIDLPFIGEISVKDLTVEEIQSKIQEEMSYYLKEIVVYVKLGLFNLTILGEVNRPGQYQIYQPDINIFQAIALAGNATDFANKSKVKIVHQTTKGSQIVRVDLNDANILSSPEYYLKPNDIIYVEPLKLKKYGFTSVPYGTIISAVSLLITCLTFVSVYLK
ncbi:MAG: polysaccharide biosynthesis/export family protein [Bacteroidales bacterium]|nr:polysaccharide biosynthesis/export family protein [Bacteroidales bacterium]